MPERPLKDEEVRAIETEIDAAFIDGLGIAGIWKSTLKNYAIDLTEELLTSHGSVREKGSKALVSYFMNVINGCNVLLRHIEKVGADTRTPLARDLEQRMKRAIAASSLYTTVEDAYTSYSHGYAKAVLVDKDVIRFPESTVDLSARSLWPLLHQTRSGCCGKTTFTLHP